MEDYGLLRHRMLEAETWAGSTAPTGVSQHRHEMAASSPLSARTVRCDPPIFSGGMNASSAWWGWKVEKRALEYLLTAGELMVECRQNFHRVYDLRERVEWSDDALPTRRRRSGSWWPFTVAAIPPLNPATPGPAPLETFLAGTPRPTPDGDGVPRWIEDDFRAYLRCGILAHGFARIRCDACAAARLVAFSCRGHGLLLDPR
jgi:hypothetical protein